MQVLLGLQSNALKFTERGSVNIRVMLINGGQYLKILVQDTGIGIPDEHHDKLFKLFGFVKDNKKLNINGVGLGLMISKQIVEKFNG
jgi:signal transduction histidine kinase